MNITMKITIEDITKEDIKEIIEMLLHHEKVLKHDLLKDIIPQPTYPTYPNTVVMYSVGNNGQNI